MHDHDHHDHGTPELPVPPEHPEHPDFVPQRALIRPRATQALNDLVRGAHTESPAAAAATERIRSALHRAQQLDGFVTLVRQALSGDADACRQAQDWLAALGGQDRTTRALSGEPLMAEPWIHPSAVLDVAIGGAILATDRSAALANQLLDTARCVAIVMAIIPELPVDLPVRERFGAFLERLGDFGRFEDLRLDLGGCVAELFTVMGGVPAEAASTARAEIDDNTLRIGRAEPDPICTGQRLRLIAAAGETFVERAGVTVGFTPCRELGTNVVWAPDVVTVTVPAGATTGPVYFVRPAVDREEGLATEAAVQLAGIFGSCPYLGRGADTSLAARALRQPLHIARCVLPVGTGITVTIRQAPAITSFRAIGAAGVPVTDRSLPAPGDPLSLEWAVTAGTDVRITVGGAVLAGGLPLTGRLDLGPAVETRTYTLVVDSVCGPVRRDLIVPVLRVLRFVPPDVSITAGQPATLTVALDRPATVSTSIVVASQPDQPSAPGLVTIPVGQSTAQLTYPAVPAGRPGSPALTVFAYHPGLTTAVGRVWATPPAGTHRIVASRTGGIDVAAIDVVGVHAALTTGGEVLLFAYDEAPDAYADIDTGKSALWNPVTNQVRSIPMARNLFCAGHAFVGDGSLLVAGGQSSAITVGGTLGSIFGLGRGADHDVHVFDGGWTRVFPEMPAARWYPTCATLPDGRVLIVSGYAAHAYAALNAEYEIFDGAAGALVERSAFKALLPYNFELDVYPHLQVLPGGKLFVHNHDTTWLLALDAENRPVIGDLGYTPYYNAVSTNTRSYPGQALCVLLPLDPDAPAEARILIAGGGGGPHGSIGPGTPASDTAEIFEFDAAAGLDAQPGWRYTRDAGGNQTRMTNYRLMADGVLLPDGTVAIIGGAGGGKADDAGPAVMWIESFDPVTEEFTMRTGIAVPRLYHSTAILLPDGSVMVAGSTGPVWHYSISGGSSNEFRIEIYHPPYLFRGPRPELRLPATELGYQQPLAIEIPTGAGGITKVAMIRNGSTTHTNNMDQRYVGLKITGRTDTTVTVVLPPDGTVAPPGPYLLFVVAADANGEPVPSTGRQVLLGP